jgi:hypothetical protein
MSAGVTSTKPTEAIAPAVLRRAGPRPATGATWAADLNKLGEFPGYAIRPSVHREPLKMVMARLPLGLSHGVDATVPTCATRRSHVPRILAGHYPLWENSPPDAGCRVHHHSRDLRLAEGLAGWQVFFKDHANPLEGWDTDAKPTEVVARQRVAS